MKKNTGKNSIIGTIIAVIIVILRAFFGGSESDIFNVFTSQASNNVNVESIYHKSGRQL